jgi:HK97 family phage prohead protease
MTAPLEIRKQACSIALGRAPNGEADARITISTADEDREGDVLVPEGAVFDNYRKNPVVQFAHDHYSIPIGRTVALDVLAGRGIQADWVWLQNDPDADRVRNAYEQKVLNAASVGFRPLKHEPNGKYGYRFIEWELLEWSLVPVPANPHATRLLKSLGWNAAAPLAHTLDQITRNIRDSRTLTAYQQRRLDQAFEAFTEVLTNAQPEEVAVAFVEPAEMSDEWVRQIVARGVEDELAKVFGRPSENDEAAVLQISEKDLNAAISQAVTAAINLAIGRVD